MWSAIDQPTTGREARSITVAKVEPALPGPDVGDVADTDPVELVGLGPGPSIDHVPGSSLHAEVPLPEVVRLYLSAHDEGDADVAVATFKPDGRVREDGHDYLGSSEIRNWLTDASKRFA
jgi:hypothetical protein